MSITTQHPADPPLSAIPSITAEQAKRAAKAWERGFIRAGAAAGKTVRRFHGSRWDPSAVERLWDSAARWSPRPLRPPRLSVALALLGWL